MEEKLETEINEDSKKWHSPLSDIVQLLNEAMDIAKNHRDAKIKPRECAVLITDLEKAYAWCKVYLVD